MKLEIKERKNSLKYSNLRIGALFLYRGVVYLKTDDPSRPFFLGDATFQYIPSPELNDFAVEPLRITSIELEKI